MAHPYFEILRKGVFLTVVNTVGFLLLNYDDASFLGTQLTFLRHSATCILL